MSDAKLRIGIAGSGFAAKFHYKNLRGLPVVATGGRKAADAAIDLAKNWKASLLQAEAHLDNLVKDSSVDPEEFDDLKRAVANRLGILTALLKEVGNADSN